MKLSSVCLVLLIASVITLSPGSAQQPGCVQSPTGRNPRIMWSCHQQAVWDRMKRDNHPWYSYILQNAEKDDTSAARYASRGRWSMLAYQITGDKKYARAAFREHQKGNKNFGAPLTGNALREHGIESVMLYDWTYPALNQSERDTFLEYLKRTADGAVRTGIRVIDSDQATGVYFFFAVLDQVAGTNYVSGPIPDRSAIGMQGVGGLRATAADWSSMRNAIRLYTEVMGEGGQWIESSEYNTGTMGLLISGAYAVDTATGQDFFPEVKAFRRAAVRHQMHTFTPDLRDTFQWGDVQNPNGIRWLGQDDILSYLSGLEDSPHMRQFEKDVASRHGRELGTDAAYARYFYFSNPYGSTSEWQQFAGLYLVTPGTGHVYARTGWSQEDCGFHIYFPAHSRGVVDHGLHELGSFRLRCGNEWLISRPLAYSSEPRLANQVLIMNAGPSREAAPGVLAAGFRAGEVVYAAGSSAGVGPSISRNYYNPPPTYAHESTRSALYLMDDRDRPVIVLFDRIHAEDPRQQRMPSGNPAFSRYSAAEQARMNRSLGVKQWVLHMPVRPSLGTDGRSYSWPVGNTRVHVRQVLPPEDAKHTVVDEKTDVISGSIFDEQRKFAVHSVPAVPRDFDTFLHVISANRDGEAITASPITSGDIQGVRLSRPGKSDVIALFNAKPGPKLTTTATGGRYVRDTNKITDIVAARVLKTGFDVRLPSPATVYVADLDPQIAWEAFLNQTRLNVTRYGDLFRLSLPSSGTLRLTAEAGQPLADASQAKPTAKSPENLRILPR